MTFAKFVFCSATVGLAVAMAASSYDLSLSSPTTVAGTELKPGDYKVQVADGKVMFKSGKTMVEVPGTVQTTGQKYPYTAIETSGSKLKEIHLGGTKTKVVFETAAIPAGGE